MLKIVKTNNHAYTSGLLTSKHYNPTIIHKCHWAFSTQIPQALKINNQLPFIDVNEVSQLPTFKHTKASNEQQT
jgi:predicted oxidoreductase (fatty acid repression mutant protein)